MCYNIIYGIWLLLSITFFLGLSGLSLMRDEGLLEVNPALNITQRAVCRLKTIQDLWAS